MLRRIAFENLINFKDRLCLDFQEGVNFLVGANATGKSSILELIRRCHSVNLNSSVTNLLDDREPGYIISRYEGLSDVFGTNESFDTDRAILCLFQERVAGIISIYKCICFKSKAKGGYIAASEYEKAEDNPQKRIHRFSLRHFDNESLSNFIEEYFRENPQQNEGNHHPKQNKGIKNPQRNDGNHNPQQNDGNHNQQRNERNHNPQQNEGNHNPQQNEGNHNPQQNEGNHNQQQNEGNHNPQQNAGNHNQQQNEGNHNPQQIEGNHNQQQNDGNHNPQQNDGNHNPQQNEGNHSPQQNEGNHNPQQNEGNHNPQQSDGNHNQQQNEGNHNPQQNDGNHNPQQNEGNHNQQQNDGNHNPQQNDGNHNPQQNEGNHNPQQNEGNHNQLQNEGNHNQQQNEGNHNQQQNEGNHNPQQNDGNHNPQQNEGNHNPQQSDGNHNPQQNEGNHNPQQNNGNHNQQQNERNHNPNDGNHNPIRIELSLLAEIKVVLEHSGQKVENSNKTSEILLEKLQSSFAHVFPVRSIGPIQWINGNNVSELDTKNYKAAHRRAEILWDLLPPQEPQRELRPGQSLEYKNVDEDEQSLFNRVTYPLEYEFVKDTKEGKIKVIHKNDPSSTQRHFELLKAPEGIIEVKQATLVFSHKKFKTICYEDIDKGIHNQMIENMTSFMLKEMKRKTVIIVTHNPSLINCWALGRTYVCTRKRESEGKFVNIVKKIPDKYAIQYGFHHEMKKVLFSARVLLVEGQSELNVLRALFDFIFCKKERSDLLARRLNNDDTSDRDNILRNLSLVQCVSVSGKFNFQRAKDFCEDVSIHFKVLADNDDICERRRRWDGPLNSFTVPERPTGDVNTFMWKNGTIEDALRSDCPSEIMEILEYTPDTCTGRLWEENSRKRDGYKKKLKKKINKEFENTIYDKLFAELLNNIESNEESEFLEFFRFITNQG